MAQIDGIALIDNKYLQIDIEQHPDLVKPILEKLNKYSEIEIDEDYFNEQWGKGYTPDEFLEAFKKRLKNHFEKVK